MASSSSSLTLRLQLLRYGTSPSARHGLSALCRPSPPSARLRLPAAARGLRLKPVAAASFHDEAAGRHDDDGVVATAVLLRRQVDDAAVAELELRAARTMGRAPHPPKGRPGKPKEGGGGKVHAAVPTSSAKRVLGSPAPPGLPKEGSGGQGGSHH